MSRLITFCAYMLALCPLAGAASGDAAKFSEFQYAGKDRVYVENPLDGTDFYNPILQGFYPDPSIVRKGEEYYMVCSSFCVFPGVPIFHSKDLVNWRQLGHILTRQSQLQIEGLKMSEGVYAPAIRYNPINDTFYMITTLVGGKAGGNFIVKTKNPASSWSDPIYLPQIDGIDPSLFFDDNGEAYIVHNSPPNGKPLYNGHRAIKLWQFDTATDKIVGGGNIVVNGGVDLSRNPIWIEAPHLYKKDGSYYLMCAEGGTGPQHSEVIFKSDRAQGPYIAAKNNPILSQRHLPSNRNNKVICAGHADIVSTPKGGHYGVFLACRPYNGHIYNTGRETFILPVDWSGEYPIFEGGLQAISPKGELPSGVKYSAGKRGNMPNGNFIFKDNFRAKKMDMRWVSIRAPYESFATLNKNRLILTSCDVDITERATPAFIGYRQQHSAFTVRVKMEYNPLTDNSLAGVACYQNEEFNYVLAVTLIDGAKSIVLKKTSQGKTELVAKADIANTKSNITLAIDANGADYKFGYSTNGTDITWIDGTFDGTILSTATAGGFTGCLIGMYTK